MANICIVCRENEGKHAMKACCSHIVYLCDDCSFERKRVQHEKCDTCCGRLTAEQEKLQDDSMVREYEDMQYASYDTRDDFGFGDLDIEDLHTYPDDVIRGRIVSPEELEYDRSLQEHIDNGDWDIDVEPEDVGEIVDEEV